MLALHLQSYTILFTYNFYFPRQRLAESGKLSGCFRIFSVHKCLCRYFFWTMCDADDCRWATLTSHLQSFCSHIISTFCGSVWQNQASWTVSGCFRIFSVHKCVCRYFSEPCVMQLMIADEQSTLHTCSHSVHMQFLLSAATFRRNRILPGQLDGDIFVHLSL